MNAAVFLDRDGTLIEDRGHLHSPEQVPISPDTIPALRVVQTQALLFIVTQQSGVAQGLVTAEELDQVDQYIKEYLKQAGIAIQEGHIEKLPH